MAKRISLYGNVTGQLTRVSQDDMDVELVVKGTGDVGETPDDIEIVDASDEDGNPIPKKKWDDITFDESEIEWEEPDAPEPDLDEEDEEE